MKVSRLALGCCLASVLLLGAKPGPPPPPPAPVVIGALFNMTGPRAARDLPVLQGALLAVQHCNQSEGGVDGHRLELATADTESSSERVEQRTRELLALHPVALIGLNDPSDVEKSATLAAAAQVPFLTTVSSASIPRHGPRQLFYASTSQAAEMAVAADFARERWHTAAVSGPSTELFVKAFQERGGRMVELTATPEVVFAHDPAQIPLLRQQGYGGPILGSSEFDQVKLGNDPQIFYVAQAFPEADPEFLRAYSKAYPLSHPTAWSVLGYDTVQLLAEALGKSHALDAENVRDALEALGSYDGVGGSYYFSPTRPVPLKTVFVIQNPRQLVDRVFPDDLP